MKDATQATLAANRAALAQVPLALLRTLFMLWTKGGMKLIIYASLVFVFGCPSRLSPKVSPTKSVRMGT